MNEDGSIYGLMSPGANPASAGEPLPVNDPVNVIKGSRAAGRYLL